MKKILITGITGFVGSHMADYIFDNKKDVKIFGIKRYHLSRLDKIQHIYDKINWIDCDITDPISVEKLIRKVNFVNGELNGLYDMYNENGQLETRITFKNGLKDGNMYEFLPNGFVERIRTFNKGRLIADKKLYQK